MQQILEASEKLDALYKVMNQTKNISQLSNAIKQYCVVLVQNNSEEIFINYFTQYKFMELLSKKIKEHKHSSQFLKAVFSLFEFLLQTLRRDEDLIYFLLKINQEGFISSSYHFEEEEDLAYYSNFLKLMVRTINKNQKYLAVFFNIRQTHFPLLLKLIKFYDCPDVVMHTSSKLAIMEISNNPNAFVQKFIKNFPFIIFYPLYVGLILSSLRKSVEEENNAMHLDNLQNHLKFMEEFIGKKDRQAVDIYTNTFLRTVGLYIYSQLTSISEKTLKKVKKLYKILIKYVIPQLSVIKIKTCLLLLFNTDWSSKMKKCYSTKPIRLESEYWLIDSCLEEIIVHCRKIYYNIEQPNQSIFRTINSYIPRSTDNWLYHEMQKISNIVGFKITLSEEVNHDHYLPDSFLNALWTMVDDTFETNQIYSTLTKIKDEELLYYNFMVLTQLSLCYNDEIKISMDSIINYMAICNSLSIIQMFYLLVQGNKFRFEESAFIQHIYENVSEKLTFFIMTKGMKEFQIRVKESRNKDNDTQFFQDIYRQIQCQILLFVILRNLLGFRNQSGSKFEQSEWDTKQSITAETTFRCRGFCSTGSQLSVILDGQYMKIKNRNQHLIHKEELLLHNIKFYSEKDIIVLNGNEKISFYSTSIYLEEQMKPYLLKEINFRKELAMKIMLVLREMQFQFKY